MEDLKKLRQHCEKLEKQDRQEAEQFYRNVVFPKVKEIVKERACADKLNLKYSHLMLTVGFSPEPLILSITALEPKKVFFLYTKDSEKFLDRIIEESGLKASQIDKDKIERADASDVYEKMKRRWENWGKFTTTIAIDATGGTKAMVCGVSIAAALLNIDVLYVDSEFGWILGKSKPGTERIKKLSNPFDVFGDLEELKAIELFNGHNYSLAKVAFSELIGKVSDPRRYEVEKLLSEGYEAWDSFRFGEGLENLRLACHKIEQYRLLTTAKVEQIKKNIELLEILKLNQCSESFFELLKQDLFAHTLIVDLFCNAERRAEQARYDDGIVRLYRVLELIAQYRLAKHHNINTSKVKIQDKGLFKEFEKITKEVYGAPRGLSDKIGLMDGWLLLSVLQDEILPKDCNLVQFMHKLSPRNELMIEHTNAPGKNKKYKEFKEFVKPWLAKVITNLNQQIDKHQFIRLPI